MGAAALPMRSITPRLLAALFALSACEGGGLDADDPIDDSFSGEGKADAAGVAEGSAEAIGVLRVANRASHADRRGAGKVATVTAREIVGARSGGDAIEPSDDDQRFTTLAELDAVPYVGKVAFAKLLAYARARGFVVPAACTAPAPRTTKVGLFVTPDDGADPVLDLIHGARSSIELTMYQLSSQPVIQALRAAASRGVRVRVILDGDEARASVESTLRAAGAETHRSSASFAFTHQKSMICRR